MKPNVTKERMEPMSGPDMVRHDQFISNHETDSHKHHKHQFKAHSAGHSHHMDNVEKMCGGGKARK
jgi:hypothetical protein